jgi:spore germination protein GerM
VVALFATVFLRLANPGKSTGPVAHPTPTQLAPTAINPSLTPTPSPVLVYFSRYPESFNDPTAVFPVQRVAPNSAVATYAIQQLIAGPTSAEAADGYFTELTNVLQLSGPSNCGGADFKLTLDMRGATPQVGTATLQFCRPTVSPGTGADGRIVAEITKTLTQFSTITKVAILNNNGNCFGDESGQDLCLK